MATLRDIAGRAGTSIATASAVLNGRGTGRIRVSEATRQRVLEVAETLGYRPGQRAGRPGEGHAFLLGLLFPYADAFVDHNPFNTQVMAGVFETAIRQGCNLMLQTAGGNRLEEAAGGGLPDPRADGVLLVAPPPDGALIRRCARRAYPCVGMVCAPPGADAYTVNADDETGGRMATEHLLQLGHRRIAHLYGVPSVATTEPRRRGYLQALQAAGLGADPALIARGNFDARGGYMAVLPMLDLPPARRPTAVFAANDLCAQGVLSALQDRGMRVPEDMAVVGYDDTGFAATTSPPLTSVHMPIYQIAMRATQMLIDLLKGREIPIRQPVLPVSLAVRESSGGLS